MGALWTKYKGYIIHGVAMAVIFFTPSVQSFLASHAVLTVAGGAVWGWVLHYFDGK
jgi:hypothetical protein